MTVNALVNDGLKLEISTDASTWTDVSGYATVVEPGGVTRARGEAYNFADDSGVPTTGKIQVRDITVTILYSEGASDPWARMRAAIDADIPYYMRWSPQGGHSGDRLFTSDAGKFTEVPDPGGDVATADPSTIAAVFTCGLVTPSTIA